MNKILVVDDEKFICDSIVEGIDWQSYDLRIYSACSGEEALEIIIEQEIDVLLTDIKMPMMSGIELIEKIRDKNLDVEVLILSCYNEYELIRQTMLLGASDYLFKPTMLPEDILASVLKALDKRLQENKKTDHAVQSQQDDLAKIKETFLVEIVEGRKCSSEELSDRFKLIQADIGMENVCIVLFRILNTAQVLAKIYFNDAYLMKLAVQNVLDEILGNTFMNESICIDSSDFVSILTCPDSMQDHDFRQNISKAISSVHMYLKKYMRMEVSAGVSYFGYDASEIQAAYKDAVKALQSANQKGPVIVYADSLGLEQDKIIDEYMDKAIAYIHSNLGDKKLSLHKVSSHIQLSRNYFSSLFKKTFKINFIDFVTQLRIEKARELYLNSDKKIYEIAEEVGYSDWRYFYRVYKKVTGHSLSSERKPIA